MNQQCKVCGEPAAGFHFGAFTCEGCKSFFGRSYNNLNSITECKNNGECIINKKNRTACKSCRLRKCLLVGMSKSGSRYGRRSNWFKIHCLLQEQQQAAVAHLKTKPPHSPLDSPLPLLSPLTFPHPNLNSFLRPRPNAASSPSVSSPDSDSPEPAPFAPLPPLPRPFAPKDLKDFYLPVPFHSMFLQPPLSSPFLLPPSLLPFQPPTHMPPTARPDHVSTPDLLDDNRSDSRSPTAAVTNNNEYSSKYDNSDTIGKCINNCSNIDIVNNNNNDNHTNNDKNNNNNNNNNENEDHKVTVRSKRFYLDAILGLKNTRDSAPEARREMFEEQDNPIDLSIKSSSIRDVSSQENSCQTEEPEEEDIKPKIYSSHEEVKPIPLDLSV